MDVLLWKNGELDSRVGLSYVGDATVLERTGVADHVTPHYFENNSQAKEFIIRQAYGLLFIGYEVYSE